MEIEVLSKALSDDHVGTVKLELCCLYDDIVKQNNQLKDFKQKVHDQTKVT